MPDSPSNGGTAKVLTVIVLFGRTKEQAAAWDAVAAMLDQGSEKRELELTHILVYDNTPIPLSSTLASNKLTYVHDASNGGTAAAFRTASFLAESQGCTWILFLDQDTNIPADLLDVYGESIKNGANVPAAVLPKVFNGTIPVSPATTSRLGIIRPLTAKQYAKPESRRLTAIASGALIHTSAASILRNIPSALWLDGVDHWIFLTLQRVGLNITISKAEILHHLSCTDYSNSPEWRVKSQIKSEVLLLTGFFPKISFVLYFYRLIRLIQRLSQENPKAARSTIAWLLRGLPECECRPVRA